MSGKVLFKILTSGIHFLAERGQLFDGYADGFKDGVKTSIKKSIAIMNQIFFAQQEALPRVTHIPGDLRCPVAVRRMNNAAAPNFPRADMKNSRLSRTSPYGVNISTWAKSVAAVTCCCVSMN